MKRTRFRPLKDKFVSSAERKKSECGEGGAMIDASVDMYIRGHLEQTAVSAPLQQ